MNYIESTKSNGENILKFFNISKWTYLQVYLQLIVGIGIIITSAFILNFDLSQLSKVINGEQIILAIRVTATIIILKSLYDIFVLKSINMGITTKRIVFKKGIIARKTNEIRLEAIKTVEVNQSIMGRILDYGDVKVTGRGNSIIEFKGVDSPITIKREIESVLNLREDR